MSVYTSFHKLIFTLISFIYSLFFRQNSRKYLEIIESNKELLGNPAELKVLDIGCGTGAFTWALHKAGFSVTGVDISTAMMRTARNHGLDCVKADIAGGIPFKSESFDLVCAAYVAHGMRRRYREKLFREAFRLSSATVIFHDYNKHLPAFPVIIIEGSSHKFEIKNDKNIR
jgi:SAM-dependent methyltransferase